MSSKKRALHGDGQIDHEQDTNYKPKRTKGTQPNVPKRTEVESRVTGISSGLPVSIVLALQIPWEIDTTSTQCNIDKLGNQRKGSGLVQSAKAHVQSSFDTVSTGGKIGDLHFSERDKPREGSRRTYEEALDMGFLTCRDIGCQAQTRVKDKNLAKRTSGPEEAEAMWTKDNQADDCLGGRRITLGDRNEAARTRSRQGVLQEGSICFCRSMNETTHSKAEKPEKPKRHNRNGEQRKGNRNKVLSHMSPVGSNSAAGQPGKHHQNCRGRSKSMPKHSEFEFSASQDLPPSSERSFLKLQGENALCDQNLLVGNSRKIDDSLQSSSFEAKIFSLKQSFEFFVENENGINLFVDLSSAHPMDWLWERTSQLVSPPDTTDECQNSCDTDSHGDGYFAISNLAQKADGSLSSWNLVHETGDLDAHNQAVQESHSTESDHLCKHTELAPCRHWQEDANLQVVSPPTSRINTCCVAGMPSFHTAGIEPLACKERNFHSYRHEICLPGVTTVPRKPCLSNSPHSFDSPLDLHEEQQGSQMNSPTATDAFFTSNARIPSLNLLDEKSESVPDAFANPILGREALTIETDSREESTAQGHLQAQEDKEFRSSMKRCGFERSPHGKSMAFLSLKSIKHLLANHDILKPRNDDEKFPFLKNVRSAKRLARTMELL